MMTINDQSINEILRYRNQTIKTSLVILIIIAAAIFASKFWALDFLVHPLMGAFLGVVLATLNAFSLGYAYFALVLKKSTRSVILWPISSFLLMCGAALMLALSFPQLLLGFAFGLTVPLVFGATIIFLGQPNPLDQARH